MIKIIYIGNNLSDKSKYNSTMATLNKLLIEQGFSVTLSSNKLNKVMRLLDMCYTIISKNKNTDFVLIDTFSTTNFYYALITSQIARAFSLKYIPILHGGNLPLRLSKSRFFSKLIFKNAYINITPSIYLQQAFQKKGFKTKFIPNVIPIKEYNFKVRNNFHPKLLWVRAFDKTYNPTLAIKVVALLKVKFAEVELCMVGPQKDNTLEKVKTLVTKLNLENNITFTGVLPKEEWHQLSKNYDIFINTTFIDNMPVSIIEAMALGLPIVSTNVGGLPYIISNNEDGILVDNNDEKEMANAIFNLLENPSKCKILAHNARKKAEKFDLEKIKIKWLNLFS